MARGQVMLEVEGRGVRELVDLDDFRNDRDAASSVLARLGVPRRAWRGALVCRGGHALPSLREVCPGDVVTVRLGGLRGGGGDGGSTGAEDRRAWLEMFLEKKPDKVDPSEMKRAKWTRCQISGERLAPPCVADCLGNLYNKEAVVRRMLSKTMPDQCGHIRKMKDLVPLVLEPTKRDAPTATLQNKNNNNSSDDAADFQCPVTGLEMNGRFRFYCVRANGRVVSHRAVKEARECVEELCGAGSLSGPDALLPLNGTEEEVAALRERAEARAAKRKKRKKGDGSGPGAAEKPTAAGTAKKKFRATDVMPEGADERVYASIFTSGNKGSSAKETFLCRSTSARGGALT